MFRRIVFIGFLGVAVALAAWAILPRQTVPEATRLFSKLKLQPGMIVADIGAGTGVFTVAAARYVGPEGHVYATEISQESRQAILTLVEAKGLSNVTVIESIAEETNLRAKSVDAAFLRHVYHHLTAPDRFLEDLYLSVKPGGRVAVVDRPPKWWRFWGIDAHGIRLHRVEAGATQAGFAIEERIAPWFNTGLDPLRNLLLAYYCVIFRKPASDEGAGSDSFIDENDTLSAGNYRSAAMTLSYRLETLEWGSTL